MAAVSFGNFPGVECRATDAGALSRCRPAVVRRVAIGEASLWIERDALDGAAEYEIRRKGAFSAEPHVDRIRQHGRHAVLHHHVAHLANRRAGRGELHFEDNGRWHLSVLPDHDARPDSCRRHLLDRSIDARGADQPVVPEPAQVTSECAIHEEHVVPRRWMLVHPRRSPFAMCALHGTVPNDAAER